MKTQIMGVLNVTPDSFSDGGLWTDPVQAIAHAQRMWDEGAAIIDVGAESTRPGAARVDAEQEIIRLEPIVPALVAGGLRVSVDTVNACTARWALRQGVWMINDISGGRLDPEMTRVVADTDVHFVVQHWRGMPSDPKLDCQYDSVQQVLSETLEQVDDTLKAGVSADRVVIDPGFGFAKDVETNWTLARDMGRWVKTGYPVLVGASRKRFIRARFGDSLDRGTVEFTKMMADVGVWAVRVHDVPANIEVLG